ncbi:MAG: cation:proton antiporter [Legionella sp.]|nr:cation:proton antiporter [Legionella sp.]
MKTKGSLRSRLYFLAMVGGCLSSLAFGARPPVAAVHPDSMGPVLFWVAFILFLALIGRYLASRLGQPGVLGELLIGVLIGNVGYAYGMPLFLILREGSSFNSLIQDMFHFLPLEEVLGRPVQALMNTSLLDATKHYMTLENAIQMLAILQSKQGPSWLKVSYILDVFSHFGVIFLLFMAGLESSVEELKQTGWESLRVACLGVLLPIILGFAITRALIPMASYQSLLFVGATLSATSVGITARVLSEMKQLQTREARTILGAAVIDDILGLILLAIISAFVVQGSFDLLLVGRIFVTAFLFFVGVFTMGPWLLRRMIQFFDAFLYPWESKLFTSFLFLMLLAWLATTIELNAIIGAFSAGLILQDNFFADNETNKDIAIEERPLSIRDLLRSLESILAPLFFILVGIQVKLETFMNSQVLLIAAGLLVAAIAGKLFAGFGAKKQDDRWLIGIGMLPRGEVGLIFASIGKSLQVISNELFSAIILMVIVTTFMTPLLLKARYTFRRV